MKIILALLVLLALLSWYFDHGEKDLPTTNQVILQSGSWNPTPKEIRQALAHIQSYLDQRSASGDSTRQSDVAMIREHLEGYKVQFLGTSREGKKVIWCNFFSVYRGKHDSFPDWKDHIVQVDDGGTGYWQIDYNPATEQCSGLEINTGF